MIQLNLDFSLLNKFFGIPVSRIAQYENKDLKEIMELEEQQGNKKAADFEKILSDPEKLFQIFKLSNIENKYIILQNMSESDLDNLLPYLTEDQLALGLYFFTDEKLIEMTKSLPIEELALLVFEKFSTAVVLSFMDESAMDVILKEPDMERGYAQEYLESLNQNILEQLMMNAYGAEQMGKSKKEYLDYISELEDHDFQNFLLSFDKEFKMGLISGMMKQDPDLLTLFKPTDMVRPMEVMLLKDDKIKMLNNLDKEFLIPMIKELPMDLTQVVLTQIDSREFSKILAQDFDDILSSVVLFSGAKG